MRVEKGFPLFCVVAKHMEGPRDGSFKAKRAGGDFSPGCAVGGKKELGERRQG